MPRLISFETGRKTQTPSSAQPGRAGAANGSLVLLEKEPWLRGQHTRRRLRKWLLVSPRGLKPSTRWHARFPALPREFADRRGRQSKGCTGTDAALGCANPARNLRPRDRRCTAGSSGQSGRDSPARREVLRPNAPKLRMIGMPLMPNFQVAVLRTSSLFQHQPDKCSHPAVLHDGHRSSR